MTDAELLGLLDKMRGVMVAVATGGPRIGEVNDEFQRNYRAAADALTERGIENPLPYADLWQWYGKWSADLLSYASRRAYVAELFTPLLGSLQAGLAAGTSRRRDRSRVAGCVGDHARVDTWSRRRRLIATARPWAV